MRIVTRPDFDGVVCAVLLLDAEKIDSPTRWVQPAEVQKGRVGIGRSDILANLPFDRRCALWFDHHYTNRTEHPFKGAFRLAPSAAGLIYDFYNGRFSRNYDELVEQTDKIDAADLSMDEVLAPQNYPYVMLSMTVSGRHVEDEPYWNLLTALLGRHQDIALVMADPDVKRRCRLVEQNNLSYHQALKTHTRVLDRIAVTDLREFRQAPEGNRFLVYALFPETSAHINIRWAEKDRSRLTVRVGHSIFNKGCRVNVGQMLTAFEGGGHRGAGSCTFDADMADQYIPAILDRMIKNRDRDGHPDQAPTAP